MSEHLSAFFLYSQYTFLGQVSHTSGKFDLCPSETAFPCSSHILSPDQTCLWCMEISSKASVSFCIQAFAFASLKIWGSTCTDWHPWVHLSGYTNTHIHSKTKPKAKIQQQQKITRCWLKGKKWDELRKKNHLTRQNCSHSWVVTHRQASTNQIHFS